MSKIFRFVFDKITKLLVPLVASSLLLGIILGVNTPFVGDVYQNVSDVLEKLENRKPGDSGTWGPFLDERDDEDC
mgnify:CR=1 FL=1